MSRASVPGFASRSSGVESLRPLAGGLLAALAVVGCRDNPAAPPVNASVVGTPAMNVGIPVSLPSRCGYQLTGVAFDGTYYYVAEGQFGGNCLIRYTADGQFVDQTTVNLDMRGLHWVPALGKLTTRHYNGGIVTIDYPSGTWTAIANYRTGPDQYAPAVDPAGQSYWIINGSSAEEHRLNDNVLLRSFAITTDNPTVIAVSNRWVYTVQGSTVHIYSKMTGYQVGTRLLNSPLGCQGWGFGASANGDRLLEVTGCNDATGQLTGMGGKGLTSSCGRQLTGVAFDGTNYYVAEGQFSGVNCISRFTADSVFIDQRLIGRDMRGLHFVPATGKLVTRHYNSHLYEVDYASGAIAPITSANIAPDQVAPAPDPAGGTYWIINASNAEQRQLSDNAVLRSFPVTTNNAAMIAVSNRWFYTLVGSTVNVYSKFTGYQVTTRVLASGLGCQGWGFGVSADGDRLLYVKDCGTATAELTNVGGRGLNSICGRQLTGVAFDGTYYYVAEGQFALNNCIVRYTADSQFVDARVIPIDMRGLHYVPATGQLTTRHYNGGIVGFDYPSATMTVLANYRTGPDQYAPAADPGGGSYWIINGGGAEERRLNDNTLLKAFGVSTTNPEMIAVSRRWFYTVDGSNVRVYSKGTGYLVATLPLSSPLGCQGWGFGATARGDQLLNVKTCAAATAQPTGMGARGLTASCGRQLTGVAWDGTYYYVAEGQFSANNCVSRFAADSEFVDQRLIPFDMRGLHFVPATGKLITRHYNGGLAEITYASGAIGQTYGVVAAEQVAPAPDPAGGTYWVINGGNAEQRQLSNSAIVRSFPIATDDPYVIAVADSWVFTHDATAIHAYEKSSGVEIQTIPLSLSLGCQGWGFGVSSNADRLLYVRTCSEAAARFITPPPVGNTPAGGNVDVVATDPGTGAPTGVELEFGNVTTPGMTTATTGMIGTPSAPPAPPTFLMGDPPTYYDIETTATFSGSITVCVTYDNVFVDEDQLRLLHYEGGSWTDVTSSLDIGANRICGVVTSLSPFLVAQERPSQTISFDPLPDVNLGDPDITLVATATSGLPVTYSLGAASVGCTLSGSVLHIIGVTGAGQNCVVAASQAGDEEYLPATGVTRSFRITYAFTGFLQPVDNPPLLNRTNAGRSIPVKFSLRGNHGLGVVATTPSSTLVECTSALPSDHIEENTTNGAGLTYDSASDTYTFVWKTSSAWASTCRKLIVTLDDGTIHEALFWFVR